MTQAYKVYDAAAYGMTKVEMCSLISSIIPYTT